MSTTGIAKSAGLVLTAGGVLFLAGAVAHPHAPEARDMAEVAYTQTGQILWWPAHFALLVSYVLFASFIFNVTRARGLPPRLRRVMTVAGAIAGFCVLAMLVHLLLPLGRDSVANSHNGWALWVKDVVETVDAVWALCVAAVAWSLGRSDVVGNRLTALVGLAGGLGFAVFSIFVPLTGVVVSMEFTRALLAFVPVTAVLLAAWAVVAGLSLFLRRDAGGSPALAH